jgi:hypothetical protein
MFSIVLKCIVRGDIFKSRCVLRIKFKMVDLLERKICTARQELPNLEIQS